MRGWHRSCRCIEYPNGGHVAGFNRGDHNLCRTWRRGCHIARHPFLQQQLSRLDHRLGVKQVAQTAVLQGIGNGGDRHALMVGHVTAHDDVVFIIRQTGRGKIHRLIKSVMPHRTQCRQPRIVLRRGHRINHRSQAGGIRCDNLIFAKPAFQAKAGHAEIGILIGHFQIAGIVGRFRYTPRHPNRCGIALLAGNHQPIGLFQNRPSRCPHHQRWHQIFKHAARP